MSFQVVVQPSGKSFEVNAGETILAAGLRQGVIMPYGCKNGACGSCKGVVKSGRFEQGAHQPSALTSIESSNGGALFCCSTATSDLVIEARVIAGAGEFMVKKLPCRVAQITKPAADVAILKLQLPANEKLQYLAGQYVDILLRDGNRRSYSMACAPHLAEQVELHVRHMPGGKFTDPVFAAPDSGVPTLKERDILRFEGPLGTFFLREDSSKPMVMLASGTGFAPIKAIIEHMIFKDMRRPTTLYWGGRRPHDLYLHVLCEQWAKDHEHFSYIPVVSEANASDGWAGRTGFVHQAVLADFKDLSGYQVYACGAPIVVDSAQRDFVQLAGLPGDEFFADSFTTAVDTVSVKAT